MKQRIILMLALLVWGINVSLLAGEDPSTAAYRAAYELVLDGKWREAKSKFEDLIKRYPQSRWIEGSQYWICHTREKLGEPLEDVYACYVALIESHPNSVWAKQASSNLVRLSWYLRSPNFDIQSIPFVQQQISKDEDSQLSALFALQAVDSNAALRDAQRLYDSSRSETFRGKLIYVLGSFRSLGAIAKLGEIMRSDPSLSIRSDAITLLANTRRPEAHDFLRGMVSSNDPAILRRRALEALMKARAPAIDTLCFELALHEQNQNVASSAAYYLASLGKKVDTKMFQRLLLKERARVVRRVAFFTLVGFHRQALSPETLRTMARKDPDPIVRLCASRLIGISGERLQGALAIVDVMTYRWGPDAGERILECLSQYREKVRMQNFLYWTACDSLSERVALTALQGLGKIMGASGGTDYANVAAKSPWRQVRIAALTQIVDMKASAKVEILGGILQQDPDSDVRLVAIQALLVQKNDAAVSVLLEAAKYEKEHSVRSAATVALEQVGTPLAREALRELLRR